MWLVAAALAAYLPLLGIPLRGWLDFSAFYAAGSLAFTPGVMDLAAVVRWQAESGLPITPFPYPATVALAYAPLALLPYGVAAALHVAIMFGVLLLAVRLGADLLGIPQRWAMLGTLAWAPAAAGVISGQNTPLALLLVTLAATGLVRVRSGLTGLAIGILAYKPQLVAPQLGFLALRGRWLALLVALGAIGVHYALGVVATGGDTGWPARWLATISQYTAADHLANGWQSVSLPSVGTRVELTLGIGGATLAGRIAAAVIVVACIPGLRRLPPLPAVALAAAAGLVISPHAWVYDATMLLPAIGIFFRRSMERGLPWQDRWTLAAAYAVALTWPLGGLAGGTPLVVIVVATPFVLLREFPAQRASAAGMRGATVGALPFGQ